MRLQCATIFVKDFPRMKEFYSGMLGTLPINSEAKDTWALFDCGGTCFALHAIPEEHASKIELKSPPQVREFNPIKLIFAVDDVQKEFVRLEAMGAIMLLRPWQQSSQACDGVDPEGNVFQISALSESRASGEKRTGSRFAMPAKSLQPPFAS